MITFYDKNQEKTRGGDLGNSLLLSNSGMLSIICLQVKRGKKFSDSGTRKPECHDITGIIRYLDTPDRYEKVPVPD
jgi:hypothetical protein